MYTLFEKFLIFFIFLIVIISMVSIEIIWVYNISNNIELRKIQTSASLLMVVGLLIAITQYNFNRKQAQSTFDFDRKKDTIDELPKLRKNVNEITNVLNKKIQFFERISTRRPYTVEEFYIFCNQEYENFDTCSHIMELLNLYEFLSMTIKNSLYDEELIKSMMGQNILITYELFSEYITHLRIKHANPNIYLEYEYIVHKWKSNSILSNKYSYNNK